MDKYADVTFETVHVGNGRYETRIVSWEGSSIARWDFHHPKFYEEIKDNCFWIGDKKLKIISDDFDGIIVQLQPNTLKNRLELMWYRTKKFLGLINHRILQTLWVWQLLETDFGCYHSWSDLKIWKKFEKYI